MVKKVTWLSNFLSFTTWLWGVLHHNKLLTHVFETEIMCSSKMRLKMDFGPSMKKTLHEKLNFTQEKINWKKIKEKICAEISARKNEFLIFLALRGEAWLHQNWSNWNFSEENLISNSFSLDHRRKPIKKNARMFPNFSIRIPSVRIDFFSEFSLQWD